MSVAASSARRRTGRHAWLAFLGCAFVALVVLVLAGLRSVTVRRFVLDAPNQNQVAVLRPTHRACQGPIAADGAVNQVAIWGGSVIGPSRLRVDVQAAAGGSTLASGTINATTHPNEYVARLGHQVSGSRRVRVCVTSTLNSFSLLGSPAVRAGVKMTGGKRGQQFSLVLRQTSGPSLLGSLPNAFSRASLFRPTWVGAWTFWALTALLIVTIPLGAVAIARAADEDQRDDPNSASAPRQ